MLTYGLIAPDTPLLAEIFYWLRPHATIMMYKLLMLTLLLKWDKYPGQTIFTSPISHFFSKCTTIFLRYGCRKRDHLNITKNLRFWKFSYKSKVEVGSHWKVPLFTGVHINAIAVTKVNYILFSSFSFC